jgi:hypothetical protein
MATASARQVPLTIRGAQLFLLVPLGLFQGIAATVFSMTMPMAGGDYAVGAWAVLMSLSCAVTGVRLASRGRWPAVAFVLLAAQTAFALVKLIAYGESASYVFLGFVAVTLLLLGAPPSRKFFAR